MKGLIRLLLLLLPLVAAAQSQLPPCPASGRKHNCFGSFDHPNGAKYVGEFRDDKANGQGTHTLPGGHKYVGEYRDFKRHGQGTHTFPDGAKYVGEFRDGKINGQGTFTWPSGAKYVGESRDDKQHGQGTQSYPDGAKYVGEFRDGKYHGQGAHSYPDGRKYVGEWRDNKQNGQGTFTLPDGAKHVGEWRDGKPNGQGIEYRGDGSIGRSGQWSDGNLVQSFVVDRSRFPFDEAEAARRRQQELDQKVLAEKKEREQQAAEIESERRRRQELEAQLAALQSESASRPSQQTAVIRNAHALVIGNAAYAGSMRLLNPVNDANAISQKLRSMGFTVTTVTDMNRQRLVQAMTQFRRSAASADLSLLFYSGHGVQIFGTNYILPTDVDQRDVAQATIQGVSLNSVLENFLPGKTKLVFLDACRDNPLMKTGDRSVSAGLAPIAVAQGTLISYATKDGQTASDGVGSRNSPFTTALLEHLADPQDIGVVLRRVREKVMQATGGKQQPWEYGSLTGGELVLSRIRGGRQ